MVTAFMPSRSIADSVARWPGPVILLLSTGSFGSIAVSTTRLPPFEHVGDLGERAGRQRSCRPLRLRAAAPAVSSLPKRSGFDATTIVLVLTGFLLASRLRMRCSAGC